jgi:hypothetical protein
MAAGATATSSGIRTSRPSIVVGGQDDSSLAQGLLSLVIAENVHGMYHCDARFGNWGPKANSIDFLYFDRKKLDFGKAIQVKLDADKIFDGRISAIEAESGKAARRKSPCFWKIVSGPAYDPAHPHFC